MEMFLLEQARFQSTTGKAEQGGTQVRPRNVEFFKVQLQTSVVRVIRIAIVHSSLPVDIRVYVPSTDMRHSRLLLQLILRDTALNYALVTSQIGLTDHTHLARLWPLAVATTLRLWDGGR